MQKWSRRPGPVSRASARSSITEALTCTPSAAKRSETCVGGSTRLTSASRHGLLPVSPAAASAA